jgi:hypothetical protein
MPVKRLYLAFVFLLFYCSGFSQDYTQYHQLVNKAEEEIFVHKKTGAGLDLYQQAFTSYDFIFLSDCLTATQIALYAKDEPRFFRFMRKAFENGLLPRNIRHISYIKNHPLYIRNQDSLLAMYKLCRKKYLSRIDTTLLKQVYEMYALDQAEKNGAIGATSGVSYSRNYSRQISERVEELRNLVAKKGWPGEKLMGLAQKDIMKELNTGKPDLIDYYGIYKKDYIIGQGQYEIDEEYFSSTFMYPILAHYGYTCKTNNYFDDSVYLHEIRKGNLHPKDLAAIFDFPFATSETARPNPEKGHRYFGVRKYTNLLLSPFWVNKFRATFFIAPIENDLAKWHFMDELGMYCSYGFIASRA